MLSLSHENQANIINIFSSTSRYLDGLPKIDIDYFQQILNKIYPKELHLNKNNT